MKKIKGTGAYLPQLYFYQLIQIAEY